MKRKMLLSCLVLVLIISVVLGCSSPTPTPTATPAPTAKPSPASTPSLTPSTTTAATPKPSATTQAAHPIVNIVIMGTSVGSEGYAQAVGMADLLNKKHPWIKATAKTSTGTADNAAYLQKTPDARATTIVYAATDTYYAIANAVAPFFKEKYTGMRLLWTAYFGMLGVTSFDPKIKELKDIQGKRLGLGATTATSTPTFYTAFAGMDAMYPGFTKSLTITNHSWQGSQDAMRDGLVDVTFGSLTTPPTGETKWIVPGWMQESTLKAGWHFVNMPKEAIDKGVAAGGFPVGHVIVPAGGAGTGHPAFGGVSFLSGFMADSSLYQELAYELTKFAYENMKDMNSYSPTTKSWTRQNRASWPLGVENIHPGALKFYKDTGIPAGKDVPIM